MEQQVFERVYIAREVVRARTGDQDGVKFFHPQCGGLLKETTRRGSPQRTFYCQKCDRKMHAPLPNRHN